MGWIGKFTPFVERGGKGLCGSSQMRKQKIVSLSRFFDKYRNRNGNLVGKRWRVTAIVYHDCVAAKRFGKYEMDVLMNTAIATHWAG